MPRLTNRLPALPACPNCSAAFGGPQPRFCPDCGQETRIEPPTLAEFAQQFGGAYLSTEGALWRTLLLLLTRPGELTRQYLAGRRKHFVLPLRLYLTTSVTALLLLRVLNPMPARVEGAAPAEPLVRSVEVGLGFGSTGVRDGAFFCEGLPEWMCARLRERLDVDPGALRREMAGYRERFVAHLGSTMFLLVPAFAAWVQLAWLDRRRRFTEHLVFALHLHAFWFPVWGLAQARSPWLWVPAALAVPLYGALAARRVYGGRWWAVLARAAAVAVLHLATLFAALTALAIGLLII